SASRSSSVIGGRLRISRQFTRPKPEGHLETSKVFAPSADMSLVTRIRRPSMRAIMEITVATPMTIPSRVSRVRSGLATRVPSASRRLSMNAPMPRATLPVSQGLDGIEIRRARRGPDAEDEAHQAGEDDPSDEHHGIDHGGER